MLTCMPTRLCPAAVSHLANATPCLESAPHNREPCQITANSNQSPYFYRANALLQIAVSALLRTNSVGAREVLAAEHCRYGTRDLPSIENRPW